MGKTTWRPERVEVENSCDELWLGVKGQSNPGIAGSLRKIFRYRLWKFIHGGRALEGLGVLPDYQTLLNSECHEMLSMEAVIGC